jgi:hypothetical protein
MLKLTGRRRAASTGRASRRVLRTHQGPGTASSRAR